MQGRMTVAKSVVLLIAVCLSSAAAQAMIGYYDGSTSLLDPWNPATLAVEKAVERTLTTGKMSHGGPLDGLSSWSLFTDYNFGRNIDKRQNGFNNYFNSYTVGADTLYNDTDLWGFMGNSDNQNGRNSNDIHDRIESWTYSLYTSRPVNEWMNWGMSFSYGTAENKIKESSSTTDSENYVVAPYLTMMTQVDKLNLSLSPSYVLGYQDVDYPRNGGSDTALMGKLLVMGRAAYALSDKMNIAANLNFNQVLHNHGLDTETDNDHQWFTTGAKLNYKFSGNLSGSLGYSTSFDSDFTSRIWNVGLCYAF
jgi:hypothetical protein